MASFGGTVKLTGEAAYRAALNAIAADLQKVAAQQKLTAATYDKSDTSLAAMSKRAQELQTKLAAQQDKVKTLTAALKDYQAQQEKNKSTIQSLQTQLDKEKSKLEEIARQYGTNSKEYKDQAKVVDDLEQQLKELNTQYDKNEITIKKTEAALTSAEADIAKTNTAISKLGKEAKDAGVDVESLGIEVQDSGNKAEKAANGGYTVFKNILANLATQVINKAVQGMKQLATAVYDAGVSFDSAMSKVQAVSGATAEDMDKLTEKAQEMGAKTKFSATESAEAFNYMAMAGWKTEDMLNGIEGIMNLAAAAGSDLATTSDIVTDALTAMGYKAADAGRLADVMAAASSNANTNVEMMGATFQYAASVAGSLGYSMEDVAVAIGLMANSGIKGEKAGTALRSIMQRLATDTGGAATAMHEMGVETTNADGTMRPLSNVMDDLRKAMANMTDEQKTATAKTIAGTEAMGGLLAIVNAAPEDYEKLTKAVKDSTGAAEKMANTMQNNVGGKMTLLKSQLEGIYLTIWKKVEPILAKTIDSISRSLKTVDWDAFGDKASQALEGVANGFKWILENKDLVINGLKAMLAAFAVAKVASFTKSLSENLGVTALVTAAQKANTTATVAQAAAQTTATAATTAGSTAMRIFNSVLAANPIGLVITALGLLAGGVMAAVGAFGQGSSAADEASEALRRNQEELKENKQSWQELTTAQQESLNKGMSEMSYYEDLANELKNITDENGRVKKGYEQRASFITTTLAEALGIEIKLQDGVVQGYEKITDSIDKTIEKKRAEIILSSQEAAYTEAIQKRSEALQRQAELYEQWDAKKKESAALDDEINAAREAQNWQEEARLRSKQARLNQEAASVEANYNEQKSLTEQYAWAITQYENNMALAHDNNYADMTNVNWEYIEELGNVENAKKAQIDQDIKNEQAWVTTLESMRNESNKEMIDAQITASNTKIAELQKERQKYVTTTAQEMSEANSEWDKGLNQQLSTMTGKKVEFKTAGDGLVQMYVDGVAQGKPVSKKEAESVVKNTIQGLDGKSQAEGAGKNLIQGFNNGEGNTFMQNAARQTARVFSGSILDTIKRSLGIQSPSKKTAEMGRFLVKGLGVGIEDEEDSALAQAAQFGDNVISAISGAMEDGVSTNALEALQTALPTEFNANMVTNTARMAETAQNADKSLVGYFKQALSEMKIEMDDREMGKFIDNTVTNLVYN